MSKDKRKRRSFWEPESKRAKDWIDAQTNLGISLQLLIAEAIRTYGDGDVISAHLERLEDIPNDYPIEDVEPPRKSIKKVVPSPKPKKKDVEELDVPEESEKVTPPPQPTPVIPKIEDKVEVVDDVVEDVVKPELEEHVDDDEYDPISVMMGDIGATMG